MLTLSKEKKSALRKPKHFLAKICCARDAKFARTRWQPYSRADFFTISPELKFHWGLPKISSISDQPLPSYLLKPITIVNAKSLNWRLNTSGKATFWCQQQMQPDHKDWLISWFVNNNQFLLVKYFWVIQFFHCQMIMERYEIIHKMDFKTQCAIENYVGVWGLFQKQPWK